jgi:probable HAF family extracellular repeat protein
MRSLFLFSAAALGLLACTSEETPTDLTDPTAGAKPEMAVAKTYTAVDLGTLGECCSDARDINPAGQVVGFSAEGHAFLWEKGVMTDLGTLGGTSSGATGINPSGQVVGAISFAGEPDDESQDDYNRAFLWQRGAITELGTLGGSSSWATDINPAGQVVG